MELTDKLLSEYKSLIGAAVHFQEQFHQSEIIM